MLESLFRPKSAAVIGASSKELSIGNRVIKNLIDFGFKGEIYPINPKADEIRGIKAYKSIMDFYAHESCGQCTPCREGCGWMERILLRIEEGRGLQQDIDLLKNIADNIEGRTICALGDAAAWPVQSFTTKFRDEFQAHVDEQRCTIRGTAHA